LGGVLEKGKKLDVLLPPDACKPKSGAEDSIATAVGLEYGL
jgi:hypothetical protein